MLTSCPYRPSPGTRNFESVCVLGEELQEDRMPDGLLARRGEGSRQHAGGLLVHATAVSPVLTQPRSFDVMAHPGRLTRPPDSGRDALASLRHSASHSRVAHMTRSIDHIGIPLSRGTIELAWPSRGALLGQFRHLGSMPSS